MGSSSWTWNCFFVASLTSLCGMDRDGLPQGRSCISDLVSGDGTQSQGSAHLARHYPASHFPELCAYTPATGLCLGIQSPPPHLASLNRHLGSQFLETSLELSTNGANARPFSCASWNWGCWDITGFPAQTTNTSKALQCSGISLLGLCLL